MLIDNILVCLALHLEDCGLVMLLTDRVDLVEILELVICALDFFDTFALLNYLVGNLEDLYLDNLGGLLSTFALTGDLYSFLLIYAGSETLYLFSNLNRWFFLVP